ncbi:hypothetical protein CDIK_2288 [Cucumispora dikerogammari]|nr:hypothetical protein CDIK_2288 [Cucumispora dikerogammari]
MIFENNNRKNEEYDKQDVLNLTKRKLVLNMIVRVRNNEVLGFVPTQCDLSGKLRKNYREKFFVRFYSYDESESQENRVAVFFFELQKIFFLKSPVCTIDRTFKSVFRTSIS